MLRQELQSHLDRVYPDSKIEMDHSIGGQVHIRFELGGEEMFKLYRNGTEFKWYEDIERMTASEQTQWNVHRQRRVNQATERALTIFNDTFPESINEIFVLIYEYQGENFYNASNDYLHEQFPADSFRSFYNQLETVNTRYITTDEKGNDVLEKDQVRIIIGKLPVKDINVKNILNGIANTEMGFDPGIDQRIFFFDPLNDKAFHMYDDRGCYVWSNKADNIRNVYIKLNYWIVEYHRPEIEEYFRQ